MQSKSTDNLGWVLFNYLLLIAVEAVAGRWRGINIDSKIYHLGQVKVWY